MTVTPEQIADAIKGLAMGQAEALSGVLTGLASSGGSGSRRTIACPFAYNTPNLLTGAVVYTPTVGDILHDAWVEIDTPWDGATPTVDVGPESLFTEDGVGWFGNIVVALDMTLPNAGNGQSQAPRLSAVEVLGAATTALKATGASSPFGIHDNFSGNRFPAGCWRYTGQALSNNPIEVVVSQTGSRGGTDPGSTQGAAVLYLDVSTPQPAS